MIIYFRIYHEYTLDDHQAPLLSFCRKSRLCGHNAERLDIISDEIQPFIVKAQTPNLFYMDKNRQPLLPE
ncbi:Uncharacterised protein [Mycobacteroides abscessus subsp. abscessus]|nr:Uncharacterised protein [Mycobacteroides abscessus subsp. abscessus]